IVGFNTVAIYEVPANVITETRELLGRFGSIQLLKNEKTDQLFLRCRERAVAEEILAAPAVRELLEVRINDLEISIRPDVRGRLKQALIKQGYPVEDLAGFVDGDPLDVQFRETTTKGRPFSLREYQQEAAELFYCGGRANGGSGVLVLPCGAGKTIIG